MTSKHRHVGVYPEAMDWNVGAVHLDFNLGERILTKSLKTTNIFDTFRNGAHFRGF